MPFDGDRRFRVSDRVLSRVLDGEAVLLDLAAGSYLGLDEVGTAIWSGLEEGLPAGAILARILERYDVAEAVARDDLARLLGELEARGLIA